MYEKYFQTANAVDTLPLIFASHVGTQSIGLGTGFWFFYEILSFHVADFEYNPQNREY